MSRDIQLVVAGGPQNRPRARLGNTASRWGELIPGRLLISSDIDGILEVEQPFEVPPSVKDTADMSLTSAPITPGNLGFICKVPAHNLNYEDEKRILPWAGLIVPRV